MRPETRHLLQSVSKSIAGSLAGVLVGEGSLDPADLVTDHVPELAGGAFEGATVRHVLDMRTGTVYSEDYEDPESDVRITEELGGWRPARPGRPFASLHEQIAGLANAREHGGPFEYRSILTDLLAWVMERATGSPYPELLGTRLWAPMGAEHSADITVRDGIVLADGGVCATLRDLARFGLLHLGDPALAPPVVPRRLAGGHARAATPPRPASRTGPLPQPVVGARRRPAPRPRDPRPALLGRRPGPGRVRQARDPSLAGRRPAARRHARRVRRRGPAPGAGGVSAGRGGSAREEARVVRDHAVHAERAQAAQGSASSTVHTKSRPPSRCTAASSAGVTRRW